MRRLFTRMRRASAVHRAHYALDKLQLSPYAGRVTKYLLLFRIMTWSNSRDDVEKRRGYVVVIQPSVLFNGNVNCVARVTNPMGRFLRHDKYNAARRRPRHGARINCIRKAAVIRRGKLSRAARARGRPAPARAHPT
ncbi:hypothetical protein EVAR_75911_1 [Eumeta japonica]|uniref:Uncharacterized protein n=1 Tax=Eumeta variegata TaxID=151549 RepID=A0A4C1UWP0_EUMVA|nr:hypothetical protein EVAR_75911_1 [Eumeta japonica]